MEDQGRSIFVGDIIHLLSSQDHTEELVERPVHQHLLQWLYAQGALFPGDREGTLNAWPGAGPGQVQVLLSGSKGQEDGPVWAQSTGEARRRLAGSRAGGRSYVVWAWQHHSGRGVTPTRMKPAAHTALDGVSLSCWWRPQACPFPYDPCPYTSVCSLSPWLWEHSGGHPQRPCPLSRGLGRSSERLHGQTV